MWIQVLKKITGWFLLVKRCMDLKQKLSGKQPKIIKHLHHQKVLFF